ncbi:MAG: MAPEG family protein [Hyphomicrobiaceae bacterium]|nr:MAPEG family protein [Hyphomicrobiaceae bacterium]
MPITTLYAVPLAMLYVYLSFRVISHRRAARVEIGDGADRELLRRMRVHANCAEYLPIALVLMGLAESVGAPALVLHGIGAMLLAGRLMHAYALSQTPHILRVRVLGMVLTFTAIAIGAATGLLFAVQRVA